MTTKKKGGKPAKPLTRKTLKKTRGGLNFSMGDPATQGLLLPAVQKVRDAANRSS